MLTYLQAVKKTGARLRSAGIEGAETESEMIFSELEGCPRTDLFFRYRDPVPEKLLEALESIIRRREKREPLQYILGHACFMNLTLKVNPSVLIPRPETELLVEYILKTAKHGSQILDLGTGSGAIALALAYERGDLLVTGADVSNDALRVAKSNLEKYQLDNVCFLKSDLFENLGSERFDGIAANLPYVTEKEYLTLMPEVKNFEPKLALTAPESGLALIYECIKKAPEHLNPGGFIIFEMGINQAKAIRTALENSGKFKNIKTIQDYSRRDRFVCTELI